MARTRSVGDRSGGRANQRRWKKNRAEHIQWHGYYVDGHYPAGARHHLHGAEITVESIDHCSRRTWHYSKFPSTNIKGENELYKPPYSMMSDVSLCRGWLQLGNCQCPCLCRTRKQIFFVWRQTFIAEYYRASFKLGDPIGALLEIYTTLLEPKGSLVRGTYARRPAQSKHSSTVDLETPGDIFVLICVATMCYLSLVKVF